jgi:hypothetical protein
VPESDIAKALHELGGNDKTIQAIDDAAVLGAGASSILGAYSAGNSVLQYIGVLQKDKTIDDVLNAIEDLKEFIEKEVKALDSDVLSLGKLAARIAALSALGEIRNFRTVAIFAAANPDNPQYRGELVDVLANVGSDVNRLAPGDWWKQIYSPRIYYSDGWTGLVDAGENDGQLAFDYKIQLPSYLEALSALTLVRMAGGPTQKVQLFNELAENLKALEDVHDKILLGFVRVPIPTELELKIVVQLRSSKGRWFKADLDLPPPDSVFNPVEGWEVMDGTLWASAIQKVPGGNWLNAGLPVGVADGVGGLYDVQGTNLSLLYSYSPTKVGDAYQRLGLGQLLASVEWEWDANEFAIYYGDFFSRLVLAGVGSGYRLYWEATGLGRTREFIKQIASVIGVTPRPVDGSGTQWTYLSLRSALNLRGQNFKVVPCGTFGELGVSLGSFKTGVLSLKHIYYGAMS